MTRLMGAILSPVVVMKHLHDHGIKVYRRHHIYRVKTENCGWGRAPIILPTPSGWLVTE